MANEMFPAVRINLVEQKGWERWDSAATLSERASDAAHEDFFHMTFGTVKELISEMAGDDLTSGWKGPKEWSPRKRKRTLSDEDLEWLAGQVIEGRNPYLEDTRYSILDATTWMYEEAMTPNNGDMRDAMTRTMDAMQTEFEIDEELWEPIMGDGYSEWNESGIARALSNSITFVREPDHYDRYLIFDFGMSLPVAQLLKKSKWPKKKLKSRLETEFQAFRDRYMDNFFDALDKEFDYVDISNRTNWKKHWKAMLSEESQMSVVRKELLQAIHEREAPNA